MVVAAPAVGAAFLLVGCSSSSHRSAAGPSAYRPRAPERPLFSDSLSPRSCSGWMQGDLIFSTCDPALLAKVWNNHEMTKPGRLHVEVAGRKVRAGGNPALTQVLPADGRGILQADTTITLNGSVSAGSYAYVSAGSITPNHVAFGRALYRDLGLAHGGRATIDVKLEHGEVAFHWRRADGSELRPLRWLHEEGPGPKAPPPKLPDHYADNPDQGVETYVAAINARDGNTICELFTRDFLTRFSSYGAPCWQLVSGHIGYGEESYTPLFQHAELLHVGKGYTKTNYGASFAAVPIDVRLRYRAQRYSSEFKTVEIHDVVWFQKTRDGWRLAKASKTLYV